MCNSNKLCIFKTIKQKKSKKDLKDRYVKFINQKTQRSKGINSLASSSVDSK